MRELIKGFRWSRKRIVAILLALAMLCVATGCADGDTAISGLVGEDINENTGGASVDGGASATVKGRYMETLLTSPEYFQGKGKMTQLSDGSLEIVDFENGMKSISTDQGHTWTTESVPELEALKNEEHLGGALASDGGIFLYYTAWGESTEGKKCPEKYVYLAPDGSKTEFELGLEDYTTYTIEAVFGSDSSVYLTTINNTVYKVNLQEQTAELAFEIGMPFDLSSCADGSYVLMQDGHGAYRYAVDDEMVDAEDKVLNDFLKEQTNQKAGTVMTAETSESGELSLYFASVGGIYHHIWGGSVMEQLADGALNNLGDPSGKPISMVKVADQSFLILYSEGELYSYIYDAEASSVPEKLLRVYSLNDNETVRRAISVFRKENPDVFVRLEIGLTGDDGMTENDAIHNLNTRLLAGEGPDLLLLNGLPIDSYQEKGILADLSDEVEKLKSQNTFYEGILEAYRHEEGIYALPFRYTVPLLSGKESYVDAITDLETLANVAERIAQNGETDTVLGLYTAEDILKMLYPLCAEAWEIEKGSVNRASLTEFLACAKRVYEAEQRQLDDKDKEEYEEGVRNSEAIFKSLGYSEEEIWRTTKSANSQALNLLYGTQELIAGEVYSLEDYQEITSVNKQFANRFDETLEPHSVRGWNGQRAGNFRPTGIVGLCSNAKDPETALLFLETLFAEEVQGKSTEDGFPVNADAFEAFATNPNPDLNYSYCSSSEDGQMVSLELYWPNEREQQELLDILSTLNSPMPTENLLRDEVIAIGTKALTGEKGIDECVDEIEQKISLHLQE